MIKSEIVTINGTDFLYTYSDLGLQIERDGAIYDEAYDIIGMGYEYTETDKPVADLSAEDYKKALAELGVIE